MELIGIEGCLWKGGLSQDLEYAGEVGDFGPGGK